MQQLKFQKIIEYVLDNLFDILTILVAGSLVMRHQIQPFGPDEIGELATWILAVLGLIAVSGMWDRNRRLQRIEKLARESRDLVLRKLSQKVRAEDFFLSKSAKGISNDTFTSANAICLAGMTLARTTREYLHILGQRLKAGATIRIIILEPAEPLMKELATRSFGDTTAGFWKTKLETSEKLVEIIAKTQGSKGKVELGYLPYIPSYGFAITDPNEPHGYCFVELYHHESAEANPSFELHAGDDKHWYNFFYGQFEKMWNSCRVVELPNSSE